ncbi:MAG TPA: C4-dicarboxylate transporter DcuC [Candidatus Avacidaminococcus intestinavium]|uniref:C4-dicarboxylate transporter DcuC n=1 Tax=Candidatus Avacidaminococcus intestinavium TaxID=2840684 RepID=A0A9D1MNP8_9FIRM|nr:C4-dicarboxylate transporter DcuC [Candidatus Avacidaminococcus intestinavium]
MQIYVGLVIVVGMMYLMAKRKDPKTLLFGAGMLMLLLAGDYMGTFKAFSASMKQANVFETIITSMGFAAVVKLCGADKHLVSLFAKVLKKTGPFLIIGVAFATMIVNTSITSAAGVTAAMGTVFIPLMVASGIPVPLAAGAIMCGLYGGNLNPGHVHPTIVAHLAGVEGMDFVRAAAPALVASVFASSLVLTLMAFYLQKKGNKEELAAQAAAFGEIEMVKPNFIYAMVPLIPIVMLLLGNFHVVPAFKMPVPHAMVIGSIICMLVTRTNPQSVTKEFFKAMGSAFGNVFGLLICVNIFVAGLTKLGFIKILIDYMISSPAIAKVAAVFGPFIMTLICGSGESASIAFNEAVSVHADKFGMNVLDMGAMVVLSGGIGRSMAVFSAAMILCAGIAKVQPIDIIKYNSFAMVAALLTAAAFLMF